MSLIVKLRRGEGRFWGGLKAAILAVLRFHIPVVGVLRPVFGFLYAVHVFLRFLLAGLLRFFWYEPLFRSQCAGIGRRFRMDRLPFIAGAGRIVIGDDVTLAGKQDISFGSRAGGVPEVVIGDGTFIGHTVCFASSRSIRIGDRCLIAGGVQLSDYDGHPVDAARRRAGEPTPPENIRPIVVGDDVWIGTNATILKGVTVGDRSVVAARAVVTRDVPPDVVVAGNPARVVKRLAPSEPRTESLLDTPSPDPAELHAPAGGTA